MATICPGQPIPLNTIYKGTFFKRRDRLIWRAPIICRAIRSVLNPLSVVDVGCAIGDLVKGFFDLGIEARGIEGSVAAKPYLVVPDDRVIFADLRQPLPYLERFDLVTCFEVLEHIEEEYAETLVDNLSSIADRLLLSAAPPGQGGHYHVNCRPLSYWEEKFGARGYTVLGDVKDALRHELAPWQNKPGIKAIYQNLVYFERGRHD